ncbi:MAG: hypothetical protein ACE362_25140 [Phaeodactylibacter xiamenensis]|uniref:hypothetical protein n=1 Tax=Phaeodactylibacter xiamenensis TaxID=1524460 RepID=UPI00126A3F22|nr:hypothetical protein [Phaeodactylibacter xiamenensis]MCR9053993.1 hypothetical protein [bacterium]
MKIHLLVHHKSPYLLGDYCNFIEAVYPIDDEHGKHTESISQLKLPDTFDYVVFPKRLLYTPEDFTSSLLACNRLLQKHFKARLWHGYNDTPDAHPQALTSAPYSAFTIQIPTEKISFKLPTRIGYPLIAVMLKGASRQSIWPSFRTWKKIFNTIHLAYPNATFIITGLSRVHSKAKVSTAKAKETVTDFINSIPGAINAYDVGLDNQLGLIQRADVFLSPHTGFAFLAPCLGTPWLALSGGQWAEPMPARMPFYCVMPRCKKYPCNNGDIKIKCKLRLKFKQPIECMSNLTTKQEDIIQGLKKLLDEDYTFEKAYDDYAQLAFLNQVNLRKLSIAPEFVYKIRGEK